MNLAIKDIRHGLFRFVLTCFGLGLLMTVVLAEPDEPCESLEGRFVSAARSYGGVPDRLLGGRCIAVFGADVSFGDEAVRALRFASAVRRPGARLGRGPRQENRCLPAEPEKEDPVYKDQTGRGP